MRSSRAIFVSLLLIIALSLSAQNGKVPINHATKTMLPHVSFDMRTAGYWIARHPYPDSLIMNAQQIKDFSASIVRKGSISEMHKISGSISGSHIKGGINDALKLVSSMSLYDSLGQRVPSSYWNPIRQNCNLGAIRGSVRIRYGFPSSYASQRLAPTSDNLNKIIFDTEFDEVQNSGYDIGTPHVFYHESADGKWIYGASAVTSGWYRMQDVCFMTRELWLDYQLDKDFAVVTSARADIWLDEKKMQHGGYLRMGSKLPLEGEDGDYYIVLIPIREPGGEGRIAEARILKSDLHPGYLEYRPRNVLNLAFRLLDKPYGWADAYGDTDCSSTMRAIFGCFGINLPRNSARQEQAGKLVQKFTGNESSAVRELAIIKKSIGGITLLRRPGHITLYLGSVNGRAYILQNTWAYRTLNDKKEDEVNVINSVVVSDMYLGYGSARSSMIEEVSGISILDN
ncbi:MAG: SH3 domain-containing protein [Candidatus Cloacimonadaceae bacterium]|nr:SH3 domain-containing protein [Candidatus Cloacimonadaceae bacterium]